MTVRFRSPLGAIAAALFVTSTAAAQSAQSGEFTVQKFAPAPGPRNFITVEGARTDGKMAFSLGLFANYANDPFVVKSCRTQTDCEAANAFQQTDVKVIENLFTADILASLTPIPKVQLGLRVPVSAVGGQGINTDLADINAGKALANGLSGAGLGDPMLEAKLRAFGGVNDPYVIGAAAFVTGPLGRATAKDKYIGDAGPTLGIRGIFDGMSGPLSFGGNLTAVYREKSTLGSTTLGTEFRYGVALGAKLSPVLRVLAEGFGGTKFSSENGTNSLEVDAAAQLTPLNSTLTFTAGGGAGVIEGVGVPKVRGFVGILWNNEHLDADGDGIPDDRDQCPTAPEDFDGFQDDDGCPDPDNDGDGIADKQDKCPNEPETKNGIQDDDGCPDDIPDRDHDGIADEEDKCPDDGGESVIRRKGEFYGCPDRDKDGVPDKVDKCPDEPEDTDGFQDEDGCPDPDNDGDKILDVDDQCIDVPEIYNGFQDEDGCPDEVPDRDHDGIPDNKDKCPDAPENYNGFEDDDGCPDKGPNLVEVGTDSIKIKDVINFATDSDKIVGKRSFEVLDGVASALVHHPEIFKVEVGGHTDDAGEAAHNKELSEKRAAAVVAYMTDKGVDARRLTAAGYGSEKPIADNKTKAGKAKNRRVEFQILESTKKGDTASAVPSAGAKPAAPKAPSGPAAAPAAPGAPAPAAPAPAPAPAKPATDLGDM